MKVQSQTDISLGGGVNIRIKKILMGYFGTVHSTLLPHESYSYFKYVEFLTDKLS